MRHLHRHSTDIPGPGPSPECMKLKLTKTGQIAELRRNGAFDLVITKVQECCKVKQHWELNGYYCKLHDVDVNIYTIILLCLCISISISIKLKLTKTCQIAELGRNGVIHLVTGQTPFSCKV